MKLNLGAGYTKYDGFLNVDSDYRTNPDYVVDLDKDTLPMPTNSVSEVKAFHIFEHLGAGFFKFLQELYRVCKNGAIIHVKVPHHRHDYFVGDPTHVRPITVEMMRRFSKKYNREEIDGAENGIIGTTPFALAYDVDFEIVWYDYILEPFFEEQIKGLPAEQVDIMARIYNNVIQELHFKMVVRKDD